MNMIELRKSVETEVQAIAAKVRKMVAEENADIKEALHKEVNADIRTLSIQTQMMPQLISVWVQKAKVA